MFAAEINNYQTHRGAKSCAAAAAAAICALRIHGRAHDDR